jgi:membrane protein DedA with SNARE-associated domain
MSSWFTVAGALALLSSWGYVLLLPLAIIEGPIIGVVAGFLISLGQMNWFIVFLILTVGDIIGDLIYYYLGRWGHGFWQRRAKKGLTSQRMERFKEAFEKNDFKILTINKTQALGSLVLYYAGTIKMPLWRFTWINIVGTIPKVVLFEVIGYYFGRSYERISQYLDYVGFLTLLIPVGLLLGYWLFKRYGRTQTSPED